MMAMLKRWFKITLIAIGVIVVFAILFLGVFSFITFPRCLSTVTQHLGLERKDLDLPPPLQPLQLAQPQVTSQLKLVAVQPMLIRTTSISLRVEDVPKAINQIRQLATSMKGYVSHVSQRQRDGHWSAQIVLRVPSEQYKETLQHLQKLGQVTDFTEEIEDVTEEFVDIEARLRNLKRSEEHLLELLKRTGKVSELLSVERELSNRRSEIESLEGRLRYLKHRTAFSTIKVTLLEFRPRPLPVAAFSVVKVISDAFRSVVTTARLLLTAVIWILMFGLFFGVPTVAIVWSVRKWIKVAHSRIGGS